MERNMIVKLVILQREFH